MTAEWPSLNLAWQILTVSGDCNLVMCQFRPVVPAQMGS